MPKELWINLPVKNANKSREFFTSIGFALNTQYGNSEHSACLLVGSKNIVLMLFEEPAFEGFIQHQIADTTKGTEVLFSIDAESIEATDELAKTVENAGGIIFSKPNLHGGWMYGFGFLDLDGHRWNVLYMDMEKMPKG